jgi:hypothetical protein
LSGPTRPKVRGHESVFARPHQLELGTSPQNLATFSSHPLSSDLPEVGPHKPGEAGGAEHDDSLGEEDPHPRDHAEAKRSVKGRTQAGDQYKHAHQQAREAQIRAYKSEDPRKGFDKLGAPEPAVCKAQGGNAGVRRVKAE